MLQIPVPIKHQISRNLILSKSLLKIRRIKKRRKVVSSVRAVTICIESSVREKFLIKIPMQPHKIPAMVTAPAPTNCRRVLFFIIITLLNDITPYIFCQWHKWKKFKSNVSNKFTLILRFTALLSLTKKRNYFII